MATVLFKKYICLTVTFSKIACNETCDAEGSVNATLCDKTSGKCLLCKENVINDKCSECTPGNFPFPNCNQGRIIINLYNKGCINIELL